MSIPSPRLLRRPLHCIAEELGEVSVLVGFFAVAEGDADDAGGGVWIEPDAWMSGAGDGGHGFGEHFAARVEFHEVEFVSDGEGAADVLQDGVLRFECMDLEVAMRLVLAGSAADEVLVVGGPAAPVIPSRWMQQDEAAAALDELHQGLAESELAGVGGVIGAEHDDVGAGELIDSGHGIAGVAGDGGKSGVDEAAVVGVEKVGVVVGHAAADEEDALLAGHGIGRQGI